MHRLTRWLPALALTPTSLFAGVTRTAPPEPPVAVTPPAPVTDFDTLFNEAFFLRLGFSFFVGLAVGYALKMAFKIALLVIGLMLLGVFGLQYSGIAQVDWSGVEVHYDTWASWLSLNGRAFLDFMGKHLSSTASFLAGLALGLKL